MKDILSRITLKGGEQKQTARAFFYVLFFIIFVGFVFCFPFYGERNINTEGRGTENKQHGLFFTFYFL